MYVMDAIIKLSPIGVFCLITPVVAENGPSVLGDLATVLLVAYAAYILHMVVVYSLTVKAMGGLSPIQFFKGMLPAILFAFSSASSVGTLPLNLECVQKLGAKKDVASFVLPLGATINMDGTAIYQGVCVIFIATCFGVDLTIGQPVEGIALVAGIDRIFDMGRTTVNITGDAACTLCVSKMEEKRQAQKEKTEA